VKKNRSLAIILSLSLSLFFIAPAQQSLLLSAHAQQNTPQPASLKVSSKNIGGAYELDLPSLLYDVKVFLPDDMAAGDTISGTVLAEPKGSTEEERAKNQDTLNGTVIEIGDQKIPATKGVFKLSIPTGPNCADNSKKWCVNVTVTDSTSTRPSVFTPVSILPQQSPATRQSVITPGDYSLPAIGQQGRALEIRGPFDGDFANTSLNWTATGDTENGSGEFKLLAESPRKAVFRSPTSAKGPLEVNFKEGNVETKSALRLLAIGLSAPKTQLTKGESTTMTVMVSGLAGLEQSVSLHLVKIGTVSMEGGDVQTFLIPPTGVLPNGTFMTTRKLTGQQTGGFSVTATVVVFDSCLQDESNGNTLSFNSMTGDYIFCQTRPPNSSQSVAGVMQPLRGSLAISSSDDGCIVNLQQNTAAGKVSAQINRCTQSGNATAQPASSKSTFKITDKDMRNNTCACK